MKIHKNLMTTCTLIVSLSFHIICSPIRLISHIEASTPRDENFKRPTKNPHQVQSRWKRTIIPTSVLRPCPHGQSRDGLQRCVPTRIFSFSFTTARAPQFVLKTPRIPTLTSTTGRTIATATTSEKIKRTEENNEIPPDSYPSTSMKTIQTQTSTLQNLKSSAITPKICDSTTFNPNNNPSSSIFTSTTVPWPLLPSSSSSSKIPEEEEEQRQYFRTELPISKRSKLSSFVDTNSAHHRRIAFGTSAILVTTMLLAGAQCIFIDYSIDADINDEIRVENS